MESVLIRHAKGDRVLMALPMRVIERAADALVTWIAPGTPVAYPNGIEDGQVLPLDQWQVETRTWIGEGRLDLTKAGRRHSIRHHWLPDGSFEGWYVNLQAPLRSVRGGFDTLDWQLDLVIHPNGTVHWKDEDHLEQAGDLGILTRAEVRYAREEAERILEEWPFPTGWETWKPDPAWPLPDLPANWHVR